MNTDQTKITTDFKQDRFCLSPCQLDSRTCGEAKCPKAHSFDLAKFGYVNPPPDQAPKDYDKEENRISYEAGFVSRF